MNLATEPSTQPLIVPATAPELARRFGAILAGLAALVARRFLRMPHLVGLTVLLWTRLGRAGRRFERAVTRVGTARPARARARAARASGPRPVGLPRGRGWLVRELGWEAAGFGCQLEALLAEPENRAVLAAMPGLGRILRPVCRMLGVVMPAQGDGAAPVAVDARRPVPEWGEAPDVIAAEGPGNCPGFAKAG